MKYSQQESLPECRLKMFEKILSGFSKTILTEIPEVITERIQYPLRIPNGIPRGIMAGIFAGS